MLLVASVTADARSENLWPGFRGDGNSHVAGKRLPLSWETRERHPGSWTIRLPGYGQSSPVIWQETIFVTAVSGEEKDQLHVLAISAADGEILWQKDFVGTQKVKDSDTVSRGAPTPVVDANRVYAVFESGDIFALTHAGELSWQKSFVKEFGEIKGPHGYASSPVLAEGVVIVQVAHAGPSYVLALDSATGEQRWKVEHPSQTGWSTPLVIHRGDSTQVIISTSGSVRALESATGKELWALNDVHGNSTASPTIDGDYILIGASGERGGGRRGGTGSGDRSTADTGAAPKAAGGAVAAEQATSAPGSMAIHLADQQSAKIAWNSPKVTSGYASPLVLDGLAYFVNRAGVVQCVDVATGEVKWQHRLPGQAWASPIAVNGHVLFFCKEGAVVTLKAGPELVEVAESQISATDIVYGVAADDYSWVVRTGRGLIRIHASGDFSKQDAPGNE
jgi:outer membrane protein assembly factor BamB